MFRIPTAFIRIQLFRSKAAPTPNLAKQAATIIAIISAIRKPGKHGKHLLSVSIP